MSRSEVVRVLATKDEFNNLVSSDDNRLMVLDLYDEFFGRTEQMDVTFRTLAIMADSFNERAYICALNSKLVPDLQEKYKYKPKSKPCFLFYRNGQIVAEVLGCNAPEILKLIDENMPEYQPPKDED